MDSTHRMSNHGLGAAPGEGGPTSAKAEWTILNILSFLFSGHINYKPVEEFVVLDTNKLNAR